MRIIFKNKNEFLNTLYGDKEDYSDITDKQIKELIDDKIVSLELIYDFLEGSIYEGVQQYDLGDCMNLIELFKNIEFEEKEEENKNE